MNRWIVEPEYIACLLIAVLYVCMRFERMNAVPARTRCFRVCLIFSFGAVLFDILGIAFIQNAAIWPLWMNHCAQIGYFMMTAIAMMLVVRYLVMIIYLGNEQTLETNRIFALLYIPTAIYCGLLFTTPWTGWFYHFSADFVYMRGPLNQSSFVLYLLYVAGLAFACVRNGKHIEEGIKRSAILIMPVSLVLVLFQFLSPDTMLTGTAFALVLLVLFVNFQQRQINSDSLTNLQNRAMFYQDADSRMKRKQPFNVLYVELKHYQFINSRYGQQIGDRLLCAVSQYFQGILSSTGCAYRMRSVQFALIIDDMDAYIYKTLVRTIRARFSDEDWGIGRHSTKLDASFVDLRYPDCGDDIDEMIALVEHAAHRVKGMLTNEYVHIGAEMIEAFRRRRYVQSMLSSAVEERTFTLCYQPIYDARVGCFVGAEALARMSDSNGVSISPGEFVPLAEETGMVTQIGWMLLESALRFMRAHPSPAMRFVTVNFSAQFFAERDAVARVTGLLARYRTNPAQLKIEITERVALEHVEQVEQIMRALSELGVGFYLDDFGTGFSNVFQVISLPFECIKIDHALIKDMEKRPEKFSMLNGLVYALRKSGSSILIEGIENAAQHEMVGRLDVDMLQGYYFAMPIDEESFALLCDANR